MDKLDLNPQFRQALAEIDQGKHAFITGRAEEVYPHTWEMFRYKFNPDARRLESEIVGSFTQYPVIPAWAITIHKSQGKTFDRLIIDMERGAFTHGQTYVALSRCTSLDGLILKKPIKKGHIWADWQMMKLLSEFQHRKADLEMPVKVFWGLRPLTIYAAKTECFGWTGS